MTDHKAYFIAAVRRAIDMFEAIYEPTHVDIAPIKELVINTEGGPIRFSYHGTTMTVTVDNEHFHYYLALPREKDTAE